MKRDKLFAQANHNIEQLLDCMDCACSREERLGLEEEKKQWEMLEKDLIYAHSNDELKFLEQKYQHILKGSSG